MRISDGSKYSMKNEILKDLYQKAEESIKDRRIEISKQNREYYLAPYLNSINELPTELVAKENRFHSKVRYKVDPSDDSKGVTEIWEYREEIPQINPITQNNAGYSSTSPTSISLDPRLEALAAELCEDIMSLKAEKDQLTKFIDDTLNKYSGPKQLRTAWPSSLHKYIPVMKPRAVKVKTATVIAVPEAAPDVLGTRLTTNLLEGS